MDDEFLLKWHDHHQSFFLLVEELVMREQLTDVTLACGGGEDQQLLSAHSLMLSVCSPYFRSLLSENRHKEKHHIIHLHGVSARHMQQLLLYMYRGEISISQEDLGPLIETAKCLQIKGLAMAQPNVNISSPPASSKKRTYSQMSPSGENSPPSSSIQPSNKSKKSKTKHRPPSPSIEESVISSQEYSEPIKGDIPVDDKEEEKESKDFPPDFQETRDFCNKVPPGSQLSPLGVVSPSVTPSRVSTLIPSLSDAARVAEASLYPEDRGDPDLPLQAHLAGQRGTATSVRQPGDEAKLVAAAHLAMGGDEEDGRPEECGAQSHQLHRDSEAVLSCGGTL